MPHTITRPVGDAMVSVITDGAVTFTPDLFPGQDAAHLDNVLAKTGAEAIHTNFNAVIIRQGGRVILADAGPRDLFGPSCGNLLAGLDELGIAAADVDTLLATHLHPDHVAGMITADGQAVFPNAVLHVPDAERRFWGDDANFTGALSGIAGWAKVGQAVLAAYGDRLVIAQDGAQVAPGLSLFGLPGHTPGHSGWRLDAGEAALIHVGDIVHAPALQVADPDIAISFDLDPDTARATRKRLLDQIATDGALFTGGHFLHPAFNRVTRKGQGYALEPGA